MEFQVESASRDDALKNLYSNLQRQRETGKSISGCKYQSLEIVSELNEWI